MAYEPPGEYVPRFFGGQYVSLKEFSRRCGCTRQTVGNWARKGMVKTRRERRRIYVDVSCLDAVTSKAV